jgi:DNA mismatch repair protein MutS2
MIMDQHTSDKRQFDQVRKALADCCACALGREIARRIEPARRHQTVRRWFDQVRQMDLVHDKPGLPPFGGVYDIRPQVRDAGTPAGLDAHELRRVAETLAATGNICRWIGEVPAEYDLLHHMVERVVDLTAVANQIDQAIDERGRVRDDASARLYEIRRRIEQLQEEIRATFARILRNPSIQRVLQFPNATMRGERMVLPLKTEYRGHVKGIVHTSSDSGSTLFVEPAEAVQANNAIVQLRDDERKEVGRILGELSLLVHRNEKAILTTLDALAGLDLVAAKVRYLRSREAVCPDIADGQKMLLVNARHPLLLDIARQSGGTRTVVPIDVRLGDDFDLLVITGPNTGGKTVTLKTIGLLALMAQCGIPIPAGAGSVMPLFGRIFVDVGDEQSIEQSLSTFSAHLTNILHVLQHANNRSLVLLDELGSGTDPDEGAAIGRAVVDELLRIGCRAVVTTHLSQLKSIAFFKERVDNGSVEFDVETLRPTYRLRLGEPGNSNALTIAERLGMPKRLVRRARGYLSRKSEAVKQAIAATLDSRRQAERARLDAHQALLDAERQRVQYEQEMRRLEAEREAQFAWYEWVKSLTPGTEVFVRRFDRSARLVRLQLHKQTALVNAGAVDMEVHLGELSRPQD